MSPLHPSAGSRGLPSPYSAASEFTPTDISGLSLWMRSDTGLATSGARQFTATSNEYFIASDDTWNSPSGDFTYTGWIYLDSKSAQRTILGKWTGGGQNSLLLRTDTTGEIDFFISNDGSAASSVSTTDVGLNKWVFFVVYHDNGNEIGINFNNGSFSTTSHTTGIHDSTASFHLGSANGASETFYGRIARIGLWHRLLTTDEITYLYNQGNGRLFAALGEAGTDGSNLLTSLQAYYNLNEASGNAIDAHTGGHDLTDTNSVTAAKGPEETVVSDSIGSNHGSLIDMGGANWSSDVPSIFSNSDYSLTFNGSSEDVRLSAEITLATNATIALWFKADVLDPNVIVSETDAGATYVQIVNSTSIRVQSGSSLDFTVPTMSTGTWYHLAVTKSGTTYKLYLNGTESSTGSQSGSTFAFDSIGGHTTSSLYWDGKLKDVRYYNVTKNDSEVSNLYSGTDDQTSIVAQWNFNDGPQSSVISDGDTIAVWESKDSNRYRFIQDTAGKRPIYVSSGINSLASIDFDGTDDQLYITGGIGISGDVVLTMLIVLNPDSATAINESPFGMGDAGADLTHFSAFYGANFGGGSNGKFQTVHGVSNNFNSDGTVQSGAQLLTITKAAGAIDTTTTIRVDGTAASDAGSSSTGTPNVSTADTTIGEWGNKDASLYNFAGQISEILVYDSILTGSDLSNVETYLADRYGITLP